MNTRIAAQPWRRCPVSTNAVFPQLVGRPPRRNSGPRNSGTGCETPAVWEFRCLSPNCPRIAPLIVGASTCLDDIVRGALFPASGREMGLLETATAASEVSRVRFSAPFCFPFLIPRPLPRLHPARKHLRIFQPDKHPLRHLFLSARGRSRSMRRRHQTRIHDMFARLSRPSAA